MSKEYVVDGAELSCPMGSNKGKLLVPPIRLVTVNGKRQANMTDIIPMANIMTFGVCKLIPNAPRPCVPACIPWMGCKTDVLVQGTPAVLNNCKTMCVAGGVPISITKSGQ